MSLKVATISHLEVGIAAAACWRGSLELSVDILGDVRIDGKWKGGVGQVGCMKDGLGEQHPILWAFVGELHVVLELCGEAEVEAHVSRQDYANHNLPQLLIQK